MAETPPSTSNDGFLADLEVDDPHDTFELATETSFGKRLRGGARIAWAGFVSIAKSVKDYKFAYAFAILAILYFFPATYRLVAWYILPPSNYYIGELANPPDLDVLKDWPVDQSSIDSAPRSEWLSRLLNLSGQTVHTNREYVPGRAEIGTATAERPGRNWNKGSCLFVRHVTFEAISVAVDLDVHGNTSLDSDKKVRVAERPIFDPMSPKDPTRRYALMTDEQINSEARDAKQDSATFFRSKLEQLPNFIDADRQVALNAPKTRKNGPGDQSSQPAPPSGTNGKTKPPPAPLCSEDGAARCSRVAVWAYGAAAPCTIWPF